MPVLAPARTYTSLDGSRVELTPAPSVAAFTSVATATFTAPPIGRFELTAGPRSLGRDLAFDPRIAVQTEVLEEYSHGAGRLLLASGDSTPGPDGRHWDLAPDGAPVRESVTFAIWEGERFSLHTQVYGARATALDSAFEALGRLTVAERDDGLMVRPHGGVTFYLDDGPVILQDLPGVALVEVMQLTGRTARVLPRRPGTRVSGGELFAHVPAHDRHATRMHGSAHLHPDTFLRKVTPSAIATILPHVHAGEDAVMDLASGLHVRWTDRR